MEVEKSFSYELGFLQKKRASSLAEALVSESLLAAHRSLVLVLMMMGPLLKDVVTSPTLGGTDKRFLFSELHRRDKTEPEAKGGSDTEDDGEDEDEAEEPDDDGGDEDFSGDEGEEDDEDGDPDEDPEANGNQGNDDDDDDDEEGNDDDDEDEEEEEEEDDDEEEQPPAKKRK